MPVDWNEADQDDSPKIDIEVYRKLMGVVLYVLKTRPDVCVALSKESGRTHKCTEKDMAVLKQTVSYLHRSDATLGACVPERLQCSTQYTVADIHFCRQCVSMLREFTRTRWALLEGGHVSG